MQDARFIWRLCSHSHMQLAAAYRRLWKVLLFHFTTEYHSTFWHSFFPWGSTVQNGIQVCAHYVFPKCWSPSHYSSCSIIHKSLL